MKASFVLTLLAFCLCAARHGRLEAVKLPSLGNALACRKHMGVLTAGLNAKHGQVSIPVSEQNTSHPYLKIDFGHKRTGSGSITYYGVSIQECIQYCRNSECCLAINYHRERRSCLELKTLGIVLIDANYSTCLVNYKNGDDACNDVYSITGHGRGGFYYKTLHDKTPTPKDCCVKSREAPQSNRPTASSS